MVDRLNRILKDKNLKVQTPSRPQTQEVRPINRRLGKIPMTMDELNKLMRNNRGPGG